MNKFLNGFLRGYVKLQSSKLSVTDGMKRMAKSNKGAIEVSTVIWIIIVIVIMLTAVYAFFQGWISDLLDKIREVFDSKSDPVING